MSSTPNNPYLVKSMNGTITISDGMGVVIENGTIIAKEFDTNTIKPSNPNNTCNIWENCASDTHYSKSSTGTVNLGINSTANVNIGPTAGNISNGNINIATSTALTGNILIGSTTATNTLKLQTPKTECNTFSVGTIQQLPTSTTLQIGNTATTYAFIKTIQGLIIGNNPSTGFLGQGMSFLTSNSGVGSMIMNFYSSALGSLADAYISVTGGTTSLSQGDMTIAANNIAIQSSGTLMMGSITTNPIGLQTNDRVVMGLNPSTYNTTTGSITGPAVIVGANGAGPYNAFIDFYTYAGTAMTNAARIIANSNGLSITNYLTSTPLTLSSVGNVVLSAGDNTNITSTNSTNINCGTTIALKAPLGTTVGYTGSQFNFIQSTISTIIGTDPNSHSNSAGTTNGTAARIYTNATNSLYDFYSANLNGSLPSSRIISTGGTIAINTGALEIQSGSVKLLANTGDVALQASSGKVSLTGPIILNGQTTLIGSLPPTPVVGQLGGCFGWNQQAEGDLDIVCYKGGGLRGGINLYNQQTSGSVTAPVLLVKANPTNFDVITATVNIAASSTATISGTTSVTVNTATATISGTTSVTVNTATANIAGTTSVTLGVGQIPVTLNGIAYITNGNVNTTRSDYATWGGTQISWNRSGGNGENNFICYQGLGSGPGGLDIANVSTTNVYTTIMTARVNQINCVPQILASSGICFNKGNITTVGYMFCNGTWTGSLLGAGNALTPVNQSFGMTFSTVPKLQLTLWTTNTAAAMGVIVSFHSVTTTDFYICAYNARSVNAPLNAWGVHWTATGGY